jgi:acyl-CoA reductase-like NAD-dependent aldehyde dehydrogenase
VIVCSDADVELAVSATLPAKFGSAGQSCVAPSRYFVHESRYTEFVERFVDAAGKLRVGAPSDDQSDMGPVRSAARLRAMERVVQDAEIMREAHSGRSPRSRRLKTWTTRSGARTPTSMRSLRIFSRTP